MISILLITATLPLVLAYLVARHIDVIQRSWYRWRPSRPGDDWGDPRRER